MISDDILQVLDIPNIFKKIICCQKQFPEDIAETYFDFVEEYVPSFGEPHFQKMLFYFPNVETLKRFQTLFGMLPFIF